VSIVARHPTAAAEDDDDDDSCTAEGVWMRPSAMVMMMMMMEGVIKLIYDLWERCGLGGVEGWTTLRQLSMDITQILRQPMDADGVAYSSWIWMTVVVFYVCPDLDGRTMANLNVLIIIRLI
jgi:hypothetical protein